MTPLEWLVKTQQGRRQAASILEMLRAFTRLVPTQKADALMCAVMAELGFRPEDLQPLEREAVDQWKCKDCLGYPDDFMVFDSVWAAAGMNYKGGYLCLGCLEARLDRPLTSADFPRTGAELVASRRRPLFPRREVASGRPQFTNDLFWKAYQLGKKENVAPEQKVAHPEDPHAALAAIAFGKTE